MAAYRSLRQAVRNAAREPWLSGIKAYGGLRPDPLPAGLLNLSASHPEQPLWRPTLHGLARLPDGVNHQEFRAQLANSPRLHLQVRSGTFAPDTGLEEQLVAHVGRTWLRYAATDVGDGSDVYTWPLDWAVAYFCGLYDVGGGFRTVSFQRGLRGPVEPVVPYAPLTEIEPLPFIYDQEPWMSGWW